MTQHDPLSQLLALANLEVDPNECRVTGEDPVLHTRYRIGELGAAAQAAIGIAASELWQLRTGRKQSVKVDVRHAALSLRSNHYFRLNGKVLREENIVHGFFRTRDDRWIFLHCNFPNLRERTLSVLQVPAEPESVSAACRLWNASELEEAVFKAGGCAGWVRTSGEWDALPQAKAVTPLIEIIRIGDGPRVPLTSVGRPLAGIRALDLTRVIAGPVCARTLAEHGADVLKVHCRDLPHYGIRELDTGMGKLSTWLDIRKSSEADTLRNLVRDADVFVQSYRPEALARHGFSPEMLAAEKPGLVYVTLSAWGTQGPWANRRGFDSLLQCMTGMADDPVGDNSPKLLPGSAMDYISGYVLAFGTMVTLARRAREGGSWLVRASLLGTGEWIRGRGCLSRDEVAAVPSQPPTEEVSAFLDEMNSPEGRVTFMRPPVVLSETAPYYARPPVRIGSNPAVWPALPN